MTPRIKDPIDRLASSMGISVSEYVRSLVLKDLDRRAVFGLEGVTDNLTHAVRGVRWSMKSKTKAQLIDAVLMKYPEYSAKDVARILGFDYRRCKGYIWNRKSQLKKKGLISEGQGYVHAVHRLHRLRYTAGVNWEVYRKLSALATVAPGGRRPLKTWYFSGNRNCQLNYKDDEVAISVWPSGKVQVLASGLFPYNSVQARFEDALIESGAVTYGDHS